MALSPEIQKQVEQWLRPPFDEETRSEIQRLVDAEEEEELYDRFYRDLEFGTGGLRGVMGAGLNRVNRYTIARATQGLADYVLEYAIPTPGQPLAVAIAFDSRNNSDVFARETASVLAGNGIRAFVFESVRPTPELSFAVRLLGAAAGVVITASHNPKEYNGYKAYWSDGGQVVPPQDKGIIEKVQAVEDFSRIRRRVYAEALEDGAVVTIGEKIDNAFLEAILPLSMRPDICRAYSDQCGIVYTPLHGTGISLVPEALRRWGFGKVALCKEQSTPDGNFPAAPSPNPEEREALAAAIETARGMKAEIVLATDPDCDRVGVAVRRGDDYDILTGNQTLALLVHYVLESHARMGGLLPDAAVVKTIVTTELVARIAEAYGVRVDNVLTGFKYIGEKIRLFQESGEAQFLVGGEESYGYLVGTHARDKDAVVCACMIAEMTAVALSEGQGLSDRLDMIQKHFGIFEESQFSLKYPGARGVAVIQHIMKTLREKRPEAFLEDPVVEVRDYQTGDVIDAPSGRPIGATNLPRSNVLAFLTARGMQVVARPSGTEPKIKFYFTTCDTENLPIESDEEYARRREGVRDRHQRLRQGVHALVESIAGEA